LPACRPRNHNHTINAKKKKKKKKKKIAHKNSFFVLFFFFGFGFGFGFFFFFFFLPILPSPDTMASPLKSERDMERFMKKKDGGLGGSGSSKKGSRSSALSSSSSSGRGAGPTDSSRREMAVPTLQMVLAVDNKIDSFIEAATARSDDGGSEQGETVFSVHPDLARECPVEVFVWGISRVFLLDDARYHGLVLVPQVPNARSIDDLRSREQAKFINEMSRASRILKATSGCRIVHSTVLSDGIPQLRAEVVARGSSDDAWPSVIAGGARVDRQRLERGAAQTRTKQIRSAAAAQEKLWSDTGMDLHPKDAKGRMPSRKPCYVCGTPDAKYSCGNCMGIIYCSEICQKNDWGRHFSDCKKATAAH
jgi:diadenosine tetraphosphate (Ap4A) HIT family hydrolase